MGLWVPPVSFEGYQSNITTPAAVGTTVTASATPHTKGAYAQLLASLDFDVYAIEIFLSTTQVSSAATQQLVDIAIGAAASEEVIIPNLQAGWANSFNNQAGPKYYTFPFLIPAGSRLSARNQALIASDTVVVGVRLFGEPSLPVWAGTQVVAYGVDLATSKGVAVIPGASNAEGSWTEIAAATSQAHSFFSLGIGGNGLTTIQASAGMVDFGIGAAAAEVALTENLPFIQQTNETVISLASFSIYRKVASGERLAARMSTSLVAPDTLDLIAYGCS